MNSREPIYLELVEFVASGTTPETVANFRPSGDARQRLTDLVEREREASLTPEEQVELNHFIELEHILRMAKAKARLILAHRS